MTSPVYQLQCQLDRAHYRQQRLKLFNSLTTLLTRRIWITLLLQLVFSLVLLCDDYLP